jgi:branched-chain amino acid transport system substrate-binding protein
MSRTYIASLVAFLIFLMVFPVLAQDTVNLGLNYPETGPYSIEGLDQLRSAQMAVEEINAGGGILGKQVSLITTDSQSKPDVTRVNVANLIDGQGARMVFGGSSSGVAIAAGEVCAAKKTIFFGTLTYSTATTGSAGNKYVFRECYDAYAGASAMASYMSENFAGKTFLYVTADYTWGWTTEASMRKFSGTEDVTAHKGVKTPFPGATDADFKKALTLATMVKPDVLVLVLFGKDMSNAVRLATTMGLKDEMQIVVPNLTLGMAEAGGAKVMEGVVGALPWSWQVPYKYNYAGGKKYVEKFAAAHNRYPSTSGASAYNIVYEYKAAVERAGSFNSEAVVAALEGHTYTSLKDSQTWRAFDHQSVQTVYVVRCKPEAEVYQDKFKLDYFEIISSKAGAGAFISRSDWNAARKEAGKPTTL